MALLKRGYMSVKHLNRYVNEFAGRHNQRPLDTAVQMEGMARELMGKSYGTMIWLGSKGSKID